MCKFFSKQVQHGIMNAQRIFLNRVNGCSRKFNILLPTSDRAGDNHLLDSMPRPVLRFVSYGPINSFHNRLRQLLRYSCMSSAFTTVLDKEYNFLIPLFIIVWICNWIFFLTAGCTCHFRWNEIFTFPTERNYRIRTSEKHLNHYLH